MTKKSTQIVIGQNGVSAIYDDKDKALINRLGYQAERASHVDPLQPPKWTNWLQFWRWSSVKVLHDSYVKFGSGHWYIQWLNQFASWGVQTTDDLGRPFSTKKEAEIYEVNRLKRDYFKTVPNAPISVIACMLQESKDEEWREKPAESVQPTEEVPTQPVEDLIPFDNVTFDADTMLP